MKTTQLTLAAITAIIIAACSSVKKSSSSTAAATSATTETSSANSLSYLKPGDGIYAPGNDELTAIQTRYKDVTLDILKQGHTIYTEGACINCHVAQNIYDRGEEQWKSIINDMAQKANISDAQKDAVYKYVLAIKATQPK